MSQRPGARPALGVLEGRPPDTHRKRRVMEEDHLRSALERALRQSLHSAPSVASEPDVALTRWQVRQVGPAGTRHCVGWAEYEGRVTSSVVHFEPESRTATTRSGRRYRLEGPPGVDPDAEWVWSWWSDANGVRFWTDVSAEYQGLDT